MPCGSHSIFCTLPRRKILKSVLSVFFRQMCDRFTSLARADAVSFWGLDGMLSRARTADSIEDISRLHATESHFVSTSEEVYVPLCLVHTRKI